MSRYSPNREFYIPKGAMKIAPKSANVVFYVFNNRNGAPAAMCFVGKAQKPTWHYYFASEAKREAKIRAQIAHTAEREKASAERRKARNKPHSLEKGLILYTCWGYDQTNTEFFEIVDVPSPCYVLLQEISAPLVRGEESFMSGNRMPDPEHRIGEPFRRKVDMAGGSPSVSIDQVRTAWVWDGREKLVSWYA